MTWTDVASEFVWDGSLRDIYIFDTTVGDWQNALDAVRTLKPPPSYFMDGEATELPKRAQDVLDVRQQASPLMQLNVSGIRINCHFFHDAEIEFDVDPRDVSDADRLEALSGFMKLLVTATQKPVTLTHENVPSAVILSYGRA